MDWGLAGNTTLTGVVVVFLALVGLSLMIYLLGWVIRLFSVPKKGKKSGNSAGEKEVGSGSETAVNRPAKAETGGIPGEVIAVITAAVSMLSGGAQMVIRGIKPAKRSEKPRSAWSLAAMRQNTEPF